MDNGAGSYRRFSKEMMTACPTLSGGRDGLMLFINTYVGNIAVAEDLTEDTFVKLVIKSRNFTGSRRLRAGCTRSDGTPQSTTKGGRRGKRSFRSMSANADADDFVEKLENEYLREDRKIALHRAMRGLKEEYRRILWLVYFEELRYRDAAKVMGKTRRSVESLAYQARRALKDALEKEGMDDEKL